MVAIVGLVVLMICVFGGFIIAGGSLAPIIKAAPFEMFIIGGAGLGGMITGNSAVILKGAFGGFGKVIKGPKYKKEDYLAVMLLVAKIMKTLKTEGAVALEAHIENPEASAIFGEHPPILHDHDLLDLICNTVRLMVVSSSNLSPYAVEDVMDAAIKLHHHNELKYSGALATLAGALPALGIVACVLGVVKTMGAIDQPPPVLGGLIGSALVGTFLGVFLAYGIVEPFASRFTQIIDEEGEMPKVVKQIIIGTLHGHPMPLIIEAARACVSHHNQPTFAEVFDGMRGK
ncbi:MAG: flagellar motor stator protein MotA [Betaproteobacteria bacterium]|jgi:chemotaxis protein MotA|nr:flagellar motor stator protein MotA [Betaproteobacteria bacterium]